MLNDDMTIPVFDGHNDALLRLYRTAPGDERRFLLTWQARAPRLRV